MKRKQPKKNPKTYKEAFFHSSLNHLFAYQKTKMYWSVIGLIAAIWLLSGPVFYSYGSANISIPMKDAVVWFVSLLAMLLAADYLLFRHATKK